MRQDPFVRKLSPKAVKLKRSVEVKNQKLRDFYKLYDSGLTCHAAAEKVEIPYSTIRRWQYSKQSSHGIIRTPPILELAPSWAISTLATIERIPKIRRLEALSQFVSWLNWPHNPDFQLQGIVSFLAGYFYQKNQVNFLSDLKQDERDTLSKYLQLDWLARNQTTESEFGGCFDGRDRIDHQVASNICWLMLAINNATHNKRKDPSISKAIYLMRRGHLGKRFKLSVSALQDYWEGSSETSPFLFIEYFHSDMNWSFNPVSQDFYKRIDLLLAKQSELATYFRHCRWAAFELERRLDDRALKNIDFPKFPDWLESEPVAPQPISDEVISDLLTYRS